MESLKNKINELLKYINDTEKFEIEKVFKKEKDCGEELKAQKGVYAVYCKNNGCKFTIKKKNKEVELKRGEVCYIGKTCNSFGARVIGKNGHMQGGYTSFCIKIYKMFIELGEKYKKEDIVQKEKIKKWVENNLEFKFYPLKDDIAIGIIETTLIQKLNPPLNTHSKKQILSTKIEENTIKLT